MFPSGTLGFLHDQTDLGDLVAGAGGTNLLVSWSTKKLGFFQKVEHGT
ncbi:hypothetical protein [Streptomyces sp. NPDC056883]